MFTSTKAVTGQATTGRIFPGHRVTPAFSVADSSSGATVDRSSPVAYAGDGRWVVTHLWPTAFDSARLFDAALSHPLPGALATTGVQLTVTLASDVAGSTACWYAAVVRTSDGSVVATHGSAGSPLACVTGTAFTTTVLPLPELTSSDLANDVTVRLYGRSSSGAAARIDQVTVSGTTYAAFTLYPVLTRDVFAGGVETIPWGLARA